MAYGRLDVFSPEGQFQTFAMTEPVITLGRAAGNTIVIDSQNISRYHVTFTYERGRVSVMDMDSINGTFLDGVKLDANAQTPLSGGEEIQIGDLRVIYNHLDESPTRPINVPEDTTQRIELEAPAFRIDLKGPDQAVSPGAHISSEVSITNTSDERVRYVVSVTGLPDEWVRIDRREIEVLPGQTQSVVLSFKPSRHSKSKPDEYPVTIIVHPKIDNTSILRGDLILQVLPFSGFGMALQSAHATEEGVFKLHIHNQGSAPLPVMISAQNDALNIDLSPASLTLQAGQRAIIHGQAQSKKTLYLGEPRHYAFDVVVKSNDAARFTAATRAYVTVKPRLPAWTPYAAGGILVSLMALILVAVMLLTRPAPPPTVETFVVNGEEFTRGETLNVQWDVKNAENVNLYLNGTLVYTGNDSAANFDTTPYEGELEIALQAANGTSSDILATHYVSINTPMMIEQFTVQPSRLVRHVVQTLTIQWKVSGATQVTLLGLDDFTTTPLQLSYPTQGTLDNIAGIPIDPIRLALIARDSNGASIDHVLLVDVIDPVCTPRLDAVALHAGPTENYQIIGTVPPDTRVVVDAQDASGQWLRVKLAGDLQGWGARTAFICEDSFIIDNLQKELVIPTITPTPPISATPTPNPTRQPAIVTATPTPQQGVTSIPITPITPDAP